MVTPFETVIKNLQELGFFQFLLPFLLTAAIFYGLLRRSKVFGPPEQNIAVNAIVALIAAFFVWAYPILVGVDVETQFAKFMFQSTVAILVFVVGLMIASMFFPEDLPRQIGERLKGAKGVGIVVVAGVLIGFAVLLSSGLTGIVLPDIAIGGGLTPDTILTLVVIVVLIGSVAAIVGIGGKK